MHPYEFFNDQIMVSDPEELYGSDPFQVLDDHNILLHLLLAGLRSDVPHRRSNCCSALIELFKAEEVVSDVVLILDDPNVDRVEAIRLSVALHLPVEEKLIGLLTNGNEEMQSWSAWALGRYPSNKTRHVLRALLATHRQNSVLNESDAELLFASGIEGLRAQRLFDRTAVKAAESLVQIGDYRDLPLLLKLLQKGDPMVRLRVAQALADYRSDKSIGIAIASQAKRESGNIRRAMSEALLELDRRATEESE